jgi:hypothetical protein
MARKEARTDERPLVRLGQGDYTTDITERDADRIPASLYAVAVLIIAAFCWSAARANTNQLGTNSRVGPLQLGGGHLGGGWRSPSAQAPTAGGAR